MKIYKHFDNLYDAGLKLAQEINIESKNTILISTNHTTSYRSVFITDVLSKKLNIPFDVLSSRKIFCPENKNCSIGVVNEHGEVLLDNPLIDYFEISQSYLQNEIHRELEEILGHIHKYKNTSLQEATYDKNVILVDYGIFGSTKVLSAIKSLIKIGVRGISIASPIIAFDSFNYLNSFVDSITTLKIEKHFTCKTDYYKNIEKSSLNEILNKDKI